MKLWLTNASRAVRYLLRHGHWCTHPGMGAWWPCNFGAEEIRMCPDCDQVEKRPAEAPDGQ
jgi:hypothetical protein